MGILLGPIPIWVIGDKASNGGYEGRYMLAATLGAAISVASLIKFIKSKRIQLFVIGLLMLLAVNRQILKTVEFTKIWETQRSFYWQLFWRAPQVKPNTAFVFFRPFSDYMNQSSVSMAINTLYSQQGDMWKVEYWTYDVRFSRVYEDITKSNPLNTEYRGLTFTAENADSILYPFRVEGSCVWLLTAFDINNKLVPSDEISVLEDANLSQVESEVGSIPSQATFGPEPIHDWCFFYEKAELAAQTKDWKTVLNLMQTARDLDYSTEFALEYFPEIRALANSERWEQAADLSVSLSNGYELSPSMMCTLWDDLVQVTGASNSRTAALEKISEAFSCE